MVLKNILSAALLTFTLTTASARDGLKLLGPDMKAFTQQLHELLVLSPLQMFNLRGSEVKQVYESAGVDYSTAFSLESADSAHIYMFLDVKFVGYMGEYAKEVDANKRFDELATALTSALGNNYVSRSITEGGWRKLEFREAGKPDSSKTRVLLSRDDAGEGWVDYSVRIEVMP